MVNTPGGGVWKQVVKGVRILVPVTFDISVGFNPPSHFDTNDATRSFAIWLRGVCKKDDTRQRRWFFLFPEHSLAIELQHGMCISWEGNKVRHASISLVQEEGGEWTSDPDTYSLFTSSCKNVVKYVRVLNAAIELMDQGQSLQYTSGEEQEIPVVRLLSKTSFEYGTITQGKGEDKVPDGSAWFKKDCNVKGYVGKPPEEVKMKDLVRRADIETFLGTNEEQVDEGSAGGV